MNPLVSVCVLTWNHEKYILQCLQSIIEQDYKLIEIILLDNCSSDRTFEIAIAFLEKSNVTFKAIRNDKPKPISANCNILLQQANKHYVCTISGDDWMAEKNISSKIEKILKDEQTALVYSEVYTYIDSDKKIIVNKGRRRFEGWVFDELVKGNFIVAPGILMDVAKVKEVGGFNESIMVEDWDLWLRLSRRYKIGFVDEPLVYYRRHSTNISTPHNAKYIKSLLQIIEQYKGHKYYRFGKQQIIYQQFGGLTYAKGGLKNLWQTFKIQDGSLYRLNILKHNIVKLFRR